MVGSANRQERIFAFDRLGAKKASDKAKFDKEIDEEMQEGQEQANQWCPSGIFSRSQKRRI